MITLSILIPTYNRPNEISNLLDQIVNSLDNVFLDKIEIVICDNSSNNKINDLVKLNYNFSFIKYIKNSKNIGAVDNLIKCYKKSTGKYIWPIGDDDLPSKLSFISIFDLIEKNSEIIFLKPVFVNEINNKSKDLLNQNPNIKTYGIENFLIKYGNHFSFLSSFIIKNDIKPVFIEGNIFPHLFWLVKKINNSNIITVIDNSLLATGSQSGGYNLVLDFSSNYVKALELNNITEKYKRILVNLFLLFTLPSFTFHLFRGTIGDFDKNFNTKKTISELKSIFGNNFLLLFSILLLKFNKYPKLNLFIFLVNRLFTLPFRLFNITYY